MPEMQEKNNAPGNQGEGYWKVGRVSVWEMRKGGNRGHPNKTKRNNQEIKRFEQNDWWGKEGLSVQNDDTQKIMMEKKYDKDTALAKVKTLISAFLLILKISMEKIYYGFVATYQP